MRSHQRTRRIQLRPGVCSQALKDVDCCSLSGSTIGRRLAPLPAASKGTKCDKRMTGAASVTNVRRRDLCIEAGGGKLLDHRSVAVALSEAPNSWTIAIGGQSTVLAQSLPHRGDVLVPSLK